MICGKCGKLINPDSVRVDVIVVVKGAKVEDDRSIDLSDVETHEETITSIVHNCGAVFVTKELSSELFNGTNLVAGVR